MTTSLAFLHISDLHFQKDQPDPYHRKVVLESLIEEVETRPRDPNHSFSIDGIIVTGDIAFAGDRDEYRDATEFFDALLQAAGLKRMQLYVVPGNHDVDCEHNRWFAKRFDNDTEADNYCREKHKPHFTKFENFRDWYDSYFSGVRKFSMENTFQELITVKNESLSVNVLPVNSALLCLDEGEKEKGRLRLFQPWLDAATKQLKEAEAHVKIVMMHHPLEWLDDSDNEAARRSFESSAHLLLTGHLHSLAQYSRETGSGTLIYLKAGGLRGGAPGPTPRQAGGLCSPDPGRSGSGGGLQADPV